MLHGISVRVLVGAAFVAVTVGEARAQETRTHLQTGAASVGAGDTSQLRALAKQLNVHHPTKGEGHPTVERLQGELERRRIIAVELARVANQIADRARKDKTDWTADRRVLLDALVQYVDRLWNAASATPTLRKEREDELSRVFSGALVHEAVIQIIQDCLVASTCPEEGMAAAIKTFAEKAAATHQPPTSLLDAFNAYVDKGGDPQQLAPVIAAVGDSVRLRKDAASFADTVRLHEELHDSKKRERFVAALKSVERNLDPSGKAVLEKLTTTSSDADLVGALVSAQKGIVALGLGVAADPLGYHGREANAAKWLQVSFVHEGGLDSTTTIDFQQALLQILSAVTSDGINVPGKTTNPCDSLGDATALAFLSIRFSRGKDQIVARGQLLSRSPELVEACRLKKALPADSLAEVPMQDRCEGATCGSQAAIPCLEEQVGAARRMAEALASNVAMFGKLAFVADRSVGVFSQSKDGVVLSDLHEPVATEAPLVLATAPGLHIARDCGEPFGKSLRARLQTSYPKEIGKLVDAAKPGVPELRLQLVSDRSCRAQLVVDTKVAYGIAAEVPPPAKFTDAGEDVARVIGQYYVDVRRSQIPKPSRWSAVALAGLPFLRDGQPDNDRTGWILSAIDLSFLGCGLGAGAMSVSARNDYAGNPIRDLNAANAYLTTSALCLAGWVGTKIVGAALYQP